MEEQISETAKPFRLPARTSGWIVLDKPDGITSAHALNKVKRILRIDSRKKNATKIGHAGTLDPLATGVLPLAIGEATKASAFAMERMKSYRFTVAWGEFRATDDTEGEVTGTSNKRPTEKEILACLSQFTGKIMQTPPAFSAVKVDGERAYKIARDGAVPDIKPREAFVKYLNLLECSPDSAIFEMECGKGTYVRSIARDMARVLETAGHVTAIRRLHVGPFAEKDAISLDKLAEIVHKGEITTVLHPVESVLDDIPAREIPSGLAGLLQRGQSLELAPGDPTPEGTRFRIYDKTKLVAVGEVSEGSMKPVRVFNL